MSDLCMYQFKDTVWNDFAYNDDHLKHSGGQRSAVYCVTSDCLLKNSLHQRYTDLYNSEYRVSAEDADHRIGVGSTEMACNEFPADGSILDNNADAVDNNSYGYILDDTTHPVHSLDFFESDKDSSDFLYYALPEIGNFEDVDMIFRSCDSTFGLGAIKENEPDWFPAASDTSGCVELVKSSLEFEHPEFSMGNDILGNHESSKSYSANGFLLRTAPTSSGETFLNSEKFASYKSFLDDSVVKDAKYELFPIEQINEGQKESKLQKRSTGKLKDQKVRSTGSNYVDNLASGVIEQPYKAKSYQRSPYLSNGLQEKASDLSSSNYLHSSLAWVGTDITRLSDVSEAYPAKSAVRSQDHDLNLNPSSPVDTPLTSNQLLTTESSCDHPCQETDLSGGVKREKLFNRQVSYSSVNQSLSNGGETVKMTKGNRDLAAKLESSPGILAELCPSSNIQEKGLAMTTLVDHIFTEASNFHQLQDIMEKLDVRTKLCIRNSLYRLARSAEHRHNNANSESHHGNNQDTSATFLPEEADSFMNIETDTNPIDRSVAHLLFHRTSESSPAPPISCTTSECRFVD